MFTEHNKTYYCGLYNCINKLKCLFIQWTAGFCNTNNANTNVAIIIKVPAPVSESQFPVQFIVFSARDKPEPNHKQLDQIWSVKSEVLLQKKLEIVQNKMGCKNICTIANKMKTIE